MKESVAITKEADAKKDFSPTKSGDSSIQRLRDEHERQLGSLRGVIGNIRRDGGKPSVENIATELSSMHTTERVHVLLALQRTRGNQYVQRVVAGIQAKLKVGQPNDIYEQEADRVADAVMRMPELEVKRQPEEEDEPLQAKEVHGQISDVTPDLEPRVNATRSGGQLLPAPTRTFFEQRFGYDFSQVRVHTDAQAAHSTRALNARAYTLGHNVVFGAGQYAPSAAAGRWLLAHELTHVIQQGKAPRLSKGVRNQHHDRVQESSVRGEPLSSLSRENENLFGYVISSPSAPSNMIYRVVWYPNIDTGRDTRPWGSGPNGDALEAATDGGTTINIWRPHNGTTYWCHGYTFGGSTARGGPYSTWGQFVPTILSDDGWQRVHSCVASVGDIVVFYSGTVAHSGIIRSVSAPNGQIDEAASTLESKWGQGALNTSSWLRNARQYGNYRCFSKSPANGPCAGDGAHERS